MVIKLHLPLHEVHVWFHGMTKWSPPTLVSFASRLKPPLVRVARELHFHTVSLKYRKSGLGRTWCTHCSRGIITPSNYDYQVRTFPDRTGLQYTAVHGSSWSIPHHFLHKSQSCSWQHCACQRLYCHQSFNDLHSTDLTGHWTFFDTLLSQHLLDIFNSQGLLHSPWRCHWDLWAHNLLMRTFQRFIGFCSTTASSWIRRNGYYMTSTTLLLGQMDLQTTCWGSSRRCNDLIKVESLQSLRGQNFSECD